jgi:hypothetical protein
MRKIGIAIDPWKLAIFDRWLTQSGYEYANVVLPAPKAGDPELVFLTVRTKDVPALGEVVRAANNESKLYGARQ